MKAQERRKEIARTLLASSLPVSGSQLSTQFGVSRQIIVQDISVLRAEGYNILSTHSGYVILSTPLVERVFKLNHTTAETEDELSTIVRLGGTVVDVFVWHKVYGKITAALNIGTPAQVERFLDGVRSGKSTELMNITGGYHYHTVRAERAEVLDVIEKRLRSKGYIAPEI